MDEAAWLSAENPTLMLEFLKGKSSNRKLMLFATACLRRVWPLLPEPRLRRLIEVAEDEADGGVTSRTIAAAIRGTKGHGLSDEAGGHALSAVRELRDWLEKRERRVWSHLKAQVIARNTCGAATYNTFHTSGYERGDTPASQTPVWQAAETVESAAQCTLLRCIFGNPFRPLLPSEPWNGSVVPRLAEATYDNRLLYSGELDNARLAVLADALEDAGCMNTGWLGHLRSSGPHVRGCFVIDALLEKS